MTLSFDDEFFGDIFKFGPNNETSQLFGNQLSIFALHNDRSEKNLKQEERVKNPLQTHQPILEENEA